MILLTWRIESCCLIYYVLVVLYVFLFLGTDIIALDYGLVFIFIFLFIF